jgi:lipopolysaccharide biosynthesis glycosyltransferase
MSTRNPDAGSPSPPILLVVIDCEEDFDWSRPLQETQYSLQSTHNLDIIQDLFAEYGMVPVYVVGYPIVDHETAWKPLAQYLAAGQCQIGAHLHPWVTPPFLEASTLHNSFPGNLPAALELAKLQTLVARLIDRFGQTPTVYKAGRYGIGPSTAANLATLGFRIDVSMMPFWNFYDNEGPTFTQASSSPFWLRTAQQILEIPVTTGFIGIAHTLGPTLHPLIDKPLLRSLRVPALLARSGILSRVRLSPEGMPLTEAKSLTRELLRKGQRVFQLSFHSTSLVPGSAPYVRTIEERDRFVDWIRQYLHFFRHELAGVTGVPGQVYDLMNQTKTVDPAPVTDVMHVLLCCNALYFQHLAVVITSLAENNRNRPINVVVVVERNDALAEGKLRQTLCLYPHMTVNFRVFQPDPALALPVRGHYTRDVYTRLWVADFFDPAVARVLYLDCDMVIVGSLEALWATSLDGRTLGAVSIPGSTCCAAYSIPEAFGYFNSGVLLIDLPRWRETDAFRRVLDYIVDNAAILVDMDQDALNAVLYRDRKPLDYVWNVISPFYFNYHDLRLPPDEPQRVRDQARIVHFNGASKPWSYFSQHPRRSDYYRYLKATAWRDFRPADRTLRNRLRRHLARLIPAECRRRFRA